MREYCWSCFQPAFSCFCSWLNPFDPGVQFVILSHPIEAYKGIATGRLSHMMLKGSALIIGQDYSDNEKLNAILTDSKLFPVILYPGRESLNLSNLSQEERLASFPKDKKLAVIVIDGTWSTARKTVHVSRNLQSIPRICFTPTVGSNFRVRKQPRPECTSTIEAIHHTLDLLKGPPTPRREYQVHDRLLSTFERMVSLRVDLAGGRRDKRRLT